MNFKFKPVTLALIIAGVVSAPLAVFADGGASFFSSTENNEDAMLQTELSAINNRLTQLETKQNALPQAKGYKALQVQGRSAETDYLLNDSRPVGKELFVLKSKAKTSVSEPLFYIGANVRGQANYTRFTDAASSSIYSQSVTLNRAAVGFLSTFNDSMTGFIDITNRSPMVQHAYVLWGDLREQPYYVLIGKNDVNFGSFERYSLLSEPLTKTWFSPSQIAQLSVGYVENDIELSASFFGGSTMNLVDDVPTVTEISSKTILPRTSNRVGNFALNAGYNFDVLGAHSKVGLGLLGGSGYVTTRNGTNPAADIYADLKMGRLSIHTEYVRTLHGSGSDVAATTLNETTVIATGSENAIVDAWSLDTAYDFPVQGYDTRATLGLSKFSPCKDAYINKFVLSYNVGIAKGLDAGVEYSYSSTYGSAGTEIYNAGQIAAVMSAYF